MKILQFLGTGTVHEEKGQGCQDRLLAEGFFDGKNILAVSDGCSSSLYGGEAAQCNVDVVRKIFSRYSIDSLDYNAFAELFADVKRVEDSCKGDLTACFEVAFKSSLFEISKKLTNKNIRKFNFEDYCATLLFAVWEKEKIFIGHVGDGNIICFNKNGDIVYRSAEENGADSSHTYFTARHDFYKHFYCQVIPAKDVECIVMFSDGPQKMLKGESGSITKGACEIIAKPVMKGEINTNDDLFAVLKERIGHASSYVYDDWSVVVACKESFSKSEPVSLTDLFMETFSKIKFDDFGNVIRTEKDGFINKIISSHKKQ